MSRRSSGLQSRRAYSPASSAASVRSPFLHDKSLMSAPYGLLRSWVAALMCFAKHPAWRKHIENTSTAVLWKTPMPAWNLACTGRAALNKQEIRMQFLQDKRTWGALAAIVVVLIVIAWTGDWFAGSETATSSPTTTAPTTTTPPATK